MKVSREKGQWLKESIKENLPDAKVVLCSLTAMGGEWSRNNPKAVNNNIEIKRLCGKYGFTYVDFYTPLYDEATGMNPAYRSDEVHPNATGYRVMADILLPVLDGVFEGISVE